MVKVMSPRWDMTNNGFDVIVKLWGTISKLHCVHQDYFGLILAELQWFTSTFIPALETSCKKLKGSCTNLKLVAPSFPSPHWYSAQQQAVLWGVFSRSLSPLFLCVPLCVCVPEGGNLTHRAQARTKRPFEASFSPVASGGKKKCPAEEQLQRALSLIRVPHWCTH